MKPRLAQPSTEQESRSLAQKVRNDPDTRDHSASLTGRIMGMIALIDEMGEEMTK